jgi:hypothetical protein
VGRVERHGEGDEAFSLGGGPSGDVVDQGAQRPAERPAQLGDEGERARLRPRERGL